jgi:hypothetical protein
MRIKVNNIDLQSLISCLENMRPFTYSLDMDRLLDAHRLTLLESLYKKWVGFKKKGYSITLKPTEAIALKLIYKHNTNRLSEYQNAIFYPIIQCIDSKI